MKRKRFSYDDDLPLYRYFRLDVFNVMDLRILLKEIITAYLDSRAIRLSSDDVDILFHFFQDSSKSYTNARKDSCSLSLSETL